jgi:hypothetical protein
MTLAMTAERTDLGRFLPLAGIGAVALRAAGYFLIESVRPDAPTAQEILLWVIGGMQA